MYALVALNTVTDGGDYETITRKVFLASKAETFGTAENSVMEGSLLALFAENTNAVRVAYYGDTAVSEGGTAGNADTTDVLFGLWSALCCDEYHAPAPASELSHWSIFDTEYLLLP